MALALSCGDPAGIGLDIATAAWARRHSAQVPPFILVCDPEAVSRRASKLGLAVPVAIASPEDAAARFAQALPVLPLDNSFTAACGVPDLANAAGTIESIDRAVRLVVEGRCQAVVTCPIAKKPLYDAGFRHPGHTEYLAELAEAAFGGRWTPVMMLVAPGLRAIPVTIHVPLRSVPDMLSVSTIMETCRIAERDLRTRFGIVRPRIAVAGLNPHAGEGGSIGTEDETIVRPAIEALKSDGMDILGPLPADTMFHEAAREAYDVAVCMYHDQALIPVKTLGFDVGVNVTLGLPFVRTSPDHGTAFAIAGTGAAKPDSLVAALKLAASMSGRPAI